jgi:hypothetical protein
MKKTIDFIYVYKYWIISLFILIILLILLIKFLSNKNVIGKGKNKIKENFQTIDGKKILIGDSQTPFVDRNSTKFSRISEKGSENSLWKGGMGLKWLRDAVANYPTDKSVSHVAICIGTNGGFNSNDDVNGLFQNLKRAFPNAKFYAIKGSWGWGGNVNVTESKVNAYYQKFADNGATIIPTAIGKVNDPHGNLPVYAIIGRELDNLVS